MPMRPRIAGRGGAVPTRIESHAMTQNTSGARPGPA